MTEQIVKNKELSDRKICCFMYAGLLLLMIILSVPLSVTYILDETGTVANAAYLAGYNWGDWVNNTGGYFYKYGQAIFYYPVLEFVSNPYLLYKLLLIINGCFMALVPVMSYLILRRHLKQNDKKKCVLTSLCVSVVPAAILYSLFARSEVMLIAFAWVVLYLMFEMLDAETTKKKIVMSALVAFVSVYMYMCHSRGIVFVIAVFMIVFTVRFLLKKKNICFSAYMISLVIWLFVDKNLTRFFKNNIWGDGIKKNTVEKINVDKYSYLFTAEGVDTVIKNVTGWLFNSFLGTFGFAFLGLIFASVAMVLYIKKKNIDVKELVFNMYGFLIYFGTLALGVLFSFKSNYNFVVGTKIERGDRFVYSRYLSPTYAILIFIALFYLFYKKDVFGLKVKFVALLLGGGLIVYCRTWLKDFVNKVTYSWRNTIDSALFFDTVRYGNDANTYKYVSRGLLTAAVFAFAILLIVLVLTHFHKRFRFQNIGLVLIGICCLVSLFVNYHKLRLSTDVRPMVTMGSAITQMYEIEEETDISDEYNEVYVDNSITRHKMLQMTLPMYQVHVNKSVAAEDVENMFIICATYHVNEAWFDKDCYLFSDYDLTKARTTVVVKGEELKEELEERGYELEPVPDDYTEKKRCGAAELLEDAFDISIEYQMESFD